MPFLYIIGFALGLSLDVRSNICQNNGLENILPENTLELRWKQQAFIFFLSFLFIYFAICLCCHVSLVLFIGYCSNQNIKWTKNHIEKSGLSQRPLAFLLLWNIVVEDMWQTGTVLHTLYGLDCIWSHKGYHDNIMCH